MEKGHVFISVLTNVAFFFTGKALSGESALMFR